MTSLKTLILALAGTSLAPVALAAPTPTPYQYPSQKMDHRSIAIGLMQLNAAVLKGKTGESNNIWSRMRSRFEMSEVNPELIRRHEQYYASKSSYVNRTIDRSSPYLYYILDEVEKRGMPNEIALLPFIESAFVNKAKSRVGASGLWQFMPATGRHYGLEQTALYDGRHDVYASTDAALNYLQYLYSLFGDWSLALAAYNWGEGSVGRAVARAQANGLSPVYENLNMPNETRNYVPKLLAVRNIVNNPEAFGFQLNKIDNKPYFEAINIDQPMDIAAAAHLAGISEEEFLRLNPGFNLPVFMPKSNRKMLLPKYAVKTFQDNYRNADPKTLLSWNIYTAQSNESISNIASTTGMSVAELRRLNALRSNNLSAGRSILVAKSPMLPGSDLNAHLAQFDVPKTDPLLNQELAAERNRQPQANPTPDPILVQAAPSQPVVMAELAATPAQSATTPAVTEPDFGNVSTANATPTGSISLTSSTANENTATATDSPTPVITAANNSTATTVDGITTLAQDTSLPEQNTDAQTVATTSKDPLLALVQSSRPAAALAMASQTATPKRTIQAKASTPTRSVTVKSSKEKAPVSHKVDSGETLFAIAQKYNMNVADLISANQIKGQHIRPGQILKVGLVATDKPTQDKGNKRATAKSAEKSQTKQTAYVVRKGDTLASIAGRFNVKVSDIKRWNDGNASSNLKPGQKIKLLGS